MYRHAAKFGTSTCCAGPWLKPLRIHISRTRFHLSLVFGPMPGLPELKRWRIMSPEIPVHRVLWMV